MKKILTFFTVLLLSFSVVAGCSNTNETKPEAAVSELLDLLKKGDYEAMNELVISENGESFNESMNAEEFDELADDLSGPMFSNLSYEIGEVTEEDETNAVVKTSITNVDLGTVFGEVIVEIFALALNEDFMNEMDSLSEEEQDQLMTEKIEELFVTKIEDSKEKTVTNEVDVKIQKVDGVWKVVADEEFLNAITGNMVSAVKEINDSFNEE